MIDHTQAFRDIQVARLASVIRQIYWDIQARDDQEDLIRLTLALDTTNMTKEQTRAEVSRLLRIIEPMGWDDEAIAHQATKTFVKVIKETLPAESVTPEQEAETTL